MCEPIRRVACSETNLKIRQGLPETMHIMTTEQAAAMRGTWWRRARDVNP